MEGCDTDVSTQNGYLNFRNAVMCTFPSKAQIPYTCDPFVLANLLCKSGNKISADVSLPPIPWIKHKRPFEKHDKWNMRLLVKECLDDLEHIRDSQRRTEAR